MVNYLVARRRACFLFSFFTSVFSLCPGEISAQNPQRKLLNSAAVDRTANPRGTGSREIAVNSLTSLTDYDVEMLDEDDSRKQSRLSTYYRSLLLPRFNNAELYDESFDENRFGEDAARKASIYQGLSTVSNYILRSEFGELYRQTLDRFRSLRDLLTLRVSRGQDGDYGFGRGAGGRSRLLELRLTPNTQTGIEPRLRISEDFLLKYNSDESAPILEYNINF